MSDEYLNKLNELSKKNEAFASVTVVRREEPSSGKAGDKAIVNKQGELFGWIGGGCVKSIVCKEALDAINSGKPRLVKIGQEGTLIQQDDFKSYKMTCHSEGSVEVFIEPWLLSHHLIVIGKTAIAKALVKLAKAAGYRVTAVAPESGPQTFEKVDELITQLSLSGVQSSPRSSILIATQGESDEAALEMALQKEAAYIGFVASRKKKEAVWKYMKEQFIPDALLDRVSCPAGIDIRAKSPEEVAISILAQIIQVQATAPASLVTPEQKKEETQYYINPVCGIPVDIKHPKHILEYKGEKVYFCCDGCKVQFEKEPEKYRSKSTA